MNVVIIGANRGIGLELARQYKKLNHTVYAITRKSSPELDSLDVHIIEGIDVQNSDDIQSLSDLIDCDIDILINNAGIWVDTQLGTMQQTDFEQIFKVNSVAPVLITQQLLEKLSSDSKVIMITSRMGSIEDNTSGGRYAYRMSKAALNAAAKSLAIDLADQNIIVGIIHPGHVATDMGGSQGIPVSDAVSNIIERIDAYEQMNSGVFFHANGQVLPW